MAEGSPRGRGLPDRACLATTWSSRTRSSGPTSACPTGTTYRPGRGRARARPARRARTRSTGTSGRRSTATRRHLVRQRVRDRDRRPPAELRLRRRSRRSCCPGRSSPSGTGAGFDIEPVVRAWDDDPDLPEFGAGLAAVRTARRDRRRPLRPASSSSTTGSRRSRTSSFDERQHDRTCSARRTSCARRWRACASSIAADARGRCGSLRTTKSAKHGGDRTEHYRGPARPRARAPPNGRLRCVTWSRRSSRPTCRWRTRGSTRSSTRAVRLGGDHRGAHRGDRLLRPERALPRVRAVVGVRPSTRRHGAAGRRLLRGFPHARAGCERQSAQRGDVSSTFWNSLTLGVAALRHRPAQRAEDVARAGRVRGRPEQHLRQRRRPVALAVGSSRSRDQCSQERGSLGCETRRVPVPAARRAPRRRAPAARRA